MTTPDDEQIDFTEIETASASQDLDISPLEALAEKLYAHKGDKLGLPVEIFYNRNALCNELFGAEEQALLANVRQHVGGQRNIDLRDMHMRIFRIIRENLRYIMRLWERAKEDGVDIDKQCSSMVAHFREVLLDIQAIDMEFIPVNVLPYLQEDTIRDMESLKRFWEPHERTQKPGEDSYQTEQTLARISKA